MHLVVQISIFSLNNVTDRLTKIMNNLHEHLKILIFKVIFQCGKLIESFRKKNSFKIIGLGHQLLINFCPLLYINSFHLDWNKFLSKSSSVHGLTLKTASLTDHELPQENYHSCKHYYYIHNRYLSRFFDRWALETTYPYIGNCIPVWIYICANCASHIILTIFFKKNMRLS